MNSNLFRKQSIDRVNSPEQLNDYIRVAKPSIWILLSAIIVLLLGVLIWGIFGKINTYVDTGIEVDNGAAHCFVGEEKIGSIKKGMKVSFGENFEAEVTGVSKVPKQLKEGTDSYLLYLLGLEEGDFCYEVELSPSGASNGVYSGKITVDTVSPITFVIR